MKTKVKPDTRIVYVCDKLRELQRLFGDLCFDPNTPQDEIDKVWKQIQHWKALKKEGIDYVPSF